MSWRGVRRRGGVLVLLVVGCLLVAAPALADPAGPTHFRSTIAEVVGEAAGVELDVLGGDAFLVVRVPEGTEVEIPGYDGEPYARVAADGTIEVNQRSPARWLNDARFGSADVEVPLQADSDAPPQWQVVAQGGEYAWHDHRIHFMSPALPPAVDPGVSEAQEVLDWTVPLVVDGREVEVQGQLAWVPGPPRAVPIGLVLVALASMVGLTVLRPAWLGPLVLLGAVLTGGVGLAASVGLPAGTDAQPAAIVLPALSIAALVVARAWQRRDPARAALMVPAAALPVLVWAVLQWGALTRPIVPGPVPASVVLVVVAVAIGVGAAGVTAVGRRVLEVTALDRDGTR